MVISRVDVMVFSGLYDAKAAESSAWPSAHVDHPRHVSIS